MSSTPVIGERRTPAPPSARAIISNAATLVGTTGVTSALGAAFWWLAARHYPRSTVGVSSAIVSALTLLGTLSTIGFGTMLIGELRRRAHDARSVVTASLLLNCAVGAILGTAFALLAPLASSRFSELSARPSAVLFFAGGVAVGAAAEVLDGALIGILQGRLQLWRNVVFATTKLALLGGAIALLSTRNSETIYAVWAIGIVLSLAALGVRRVLSTRDLPSYTPQRGVLRGLPRLAFAHHAFNLAVKIPTLVLPVIVVGAVSAAANASFYVALMVAGLLYMVPNSLTTVLFAVGAEDPRALADRVHMTLRVSTAAAIAGALALVVLAGPILGIFGAGYSGGADALRILGVATLPLVVKTHYLAVTRIYGRWRGSMWLVWVGTVIELVAAVGGARADGATGVALAWVGALVLEAVVMAPTVRVVSRGEPIA